MAPFVLRCKKIQGPSRVTVIISTKIDKRATHRNRMRRLVRESLHAISPIGVSCVCIVRKNFSESSYLTIKDVVQTLRNEADNS